MEKTINALKQMQKEAERSYIENSVICYKARFDSPVPDTRHDLEMIVELSQAISILENAALVNKAT